MCEATQAMRVYPVDKNYLVIGHVIDGSGDISCAIKVATILHKVFSIPIERIEITTNQPEKVKIFNKRNFSVLSYEEAEKLDGIYLQMAAPASFHNLAGFLCRGIPTLLINEYGFENSERDIPFPHPWISCYSFGLNPQKSELGILISSGLVKHGFSAESFLSCERLKRLEKLGAQSWLSHAILQGQTIADFDRSSRLYMGYTSGAMGTWSFIGAICGLNKLDPEPKNLVFVIPGDVCNPTNYAHIQSDFLPFAEGCNIKEIQFISQDSPVANVHLIDQTKQIKTTIIHGPIEYRKLKQVLLAAEKETIVTGDQSLSEAISCNKNWVYETRDHKQELASQLQDMAFRYDAHFGLTTIPFEHTSSRIGAYGQRIYYHFLKAQQHNYGAITTLNSAIVKDCDAKGKLPDILNELTSRPVQHSFLRLDKKTIIQPDMIPFDQFVVLNLEQILSLKIAGDTGKSNLIEYQDSIFTVHCMGANFYYLKRTKTEELRA